MQLFQSFSRALTSHHRTFGRVQFSQGETPSKSECDKVDYWKEKNEKLILSNEPGPHKRGSLNSSTSLNGAILFSFFLFLQWKKQMNGTQNPRLCLHGFSLFFFLIKFALSWKSVVSCSQTWRALRGLACRRRRRRRRRRRCRCRCPPARQRV